MSENCIQTIDLSGMPALTSVNLSCNMVTVPLFKCSSFSLKEYLHLAQLREFQICICRIIVFLNLELNCPEWPLAN